MSSKPIIGITMGDPAGNGPEITVKALCHPELYEQCRPIVVGDAKMLEQAKRFVGREDVEIHVCEKVADAKFTPGVIDVLHLDLIEDVRSFPIGKVSVEGGNAAFQCVRKVIELALAGEVDATCTNALNKEAMLSLLTPFLFGKAFLVLPSSSREARRSVRCRGSRSESPVVRSGHSALPVLLPPLAG